MRASIRTTMAIITNTRIRTSSALAIKEKSGLSDVTPLLVWLSPSFPVGSYAYSHGLEWVVETGDVRDLASLEAWLAALLEHGGPWTDAVLLALTHSAVCSDDDTG